MATQSKSGRLEFQFTMGQPVKQAAPPPERRFRILVMGDFSGRGHRNAAGSLRDRKPAQVDTDNYEQVLGRLGAALTLQLDGHAEPVALQFKEMEDFHPGGIYEREGLFAGLRQIRARLLDSATFAEAAAEVRSWAAPAAPPAPAARPEPPASSTGETNQDTLARLLGGAKSPSQPPATVDINGLIRNIIAPHVVSGPHPDRDSLVAAVDKAASVLMRKLLHHPAFQAVEAAWRGVDFLIHNLELDEELALGVLDVSKDELAADLKSSEDPRGTQLYRLLAGAAAGVPGAEPWTVAAGLYTFRPAQADAELLGRLAAVAALAGVPFLGAADWAASGGGAAAATEDPKAWAAFRASPGAAHVGLALPRFLLRLPYGKNTDEVEPFGFEEMPVPPETSRYLWGNPAVACACLLGMAFTQSGWDLSPGDLLEVGDLPVHVYKEGGESKMTPCAETWLNDAAAEDLLDQGLMPFASVLRRNVIRLARFQSVSVPPKALAGPWR
jgi:type VI secretion system protein ImpC